MQHTTWWGSFNEYGTTLVGFLTHQSCINQAHKSRSSPFPAGKGEYLSGKKVSKDATPGEPLFPIPLPCSLFEVWIEVGDDTSTYIYLTQVTRRKPANKDRTAPNTNGAEGPMNCQRTPAINEAGKAAIPMAALK